MAKAGAKKTDNKEFAARLMAVQACYQMSQNGQPIKFMVDEFLQHRAPVDVDDGPSLKPDGKLFQRILTALSKREEDIKALLDGALNKSDEINIVLDEDVEAQNEKAPISQSIEPLLNAILLCGIAEILSHTEIDYPLIIDDYLHVAHAFYERNQVRFVNGILDSVANIVRN